MRCEVTIREATGAVCIIIFTFSITAKLHLRIEKDDPPISSYSPDNFIQQPFISSLAQKLILTSSNVLLTFLISVIECRPLVDDIVRTAQAPGVAISTVDTH